jgi:hypothetical protein
VTGTLPIVGASVVTARARRPGPHGRLARLGIAGRLRRLTRSGSPAGVLFSRLRREKSGSSKVALISFRCLVELFGIIDVLRRLECHRHAGESGIAPVPERM